MNCMRTLWLFSSWTVKCQKQNLPLPIFAIIFCWPIWACVPSLFSKNSTALSLAPKIHSLLGRHHHIEKSLLRSRYGIQRQERKTPTLFQKAALLVLYIHWCSLAVLHMRCELSYSAVVLEITCRNGGLQYISAKNKALVCTETRKHYKSAFYRNCRVELPKTAKRCPPEIPIYFVKPLLLTHFAARPLLPSWSILEIPLCFLCLESSPAHTLIQCIKSQQKHVFYG